MASILDNIDSTLYNGDLTLIKEKIFKRCNGQGIPTIELIDVYMLVRQLDIPFSDIDWFIENGMCIEIPRAIKNVPSLKGSTFFSERTPESAFPKVSNLALCKEYMEDKEQFCKDYCEDLIYYNYSINTRDHIDRNVMSCYLSFSPEIEFEYETYKKEHKVKTSTTFDDQLSSWWKPRKSSKISSDLASKLSDYNGIGNIVYCPDTLNGNSVYVDVGSASSCI